VVAGAAGEDIGAATAVERVVARAAGQGVGASGADQRVVTAASDDVLDVADRIARGGAADGARREVDGDAGRRRRHRGPDGGDVGPRHAADGELSAPDVDTFAAVAGCGEFTVRRMGAQLDVAAIGRRRAGDGRLVPAIAE